ncbi:MAG: hypothetical protein JRE23_13240 [Deltaproteobacteria bacterium]|nr:hypothetical protein [Deltaproteobacteria bacterium]
MDFKRWGYDFEGFFYSASSLKQNAGVYVVWCNKDRVLDVGESENVKYRVQYHDRKNSWRRQCSGTVYYSVAYIVDEQERKKLEKKIRELENPPCGEI